ncbi:unnamed protein product [Rhizophagus irregularis]|nr:unnamed protein product [Rhizophagus irregularis]
MKRNFLILKPKLPIFNQHQYHHAQQVKYDEILQKLTDKSVNSVKQSTLEINLPRTKRIAPYDKTSYEQTKKNILLDHHLNPQARKNSADDSDNFPQTEDDAIMQHIREFYDNAVDDGIIEPDSDYIQNENAPLFTYGYGFLISHLVIIILPDDPNYQ